MSVTIVSTRQFDPYTTPLPEGWDMDKAQAHLMLHGVTAHQLLNVPTSLPQFLLRFPGTIVIRRAAYVEVQSGLAPTNTPDPMFWPEVAWEALPSSAYHALVPVALKYLLGEQHGQDNHSG